MTNTLLKRGVAERGRWRFLFFGDCGLEKEGGGGADFGFVVGVAISGNGGEFGEVNESPAGGIEMEFFAVEVEPAFGEGRLFFGDSGVLLGDASVGALELIILLGADPLAELAKVVGIQWS